ncbi:thiol:disulfide interchange protein [Methanohalophilus levihalophilus]|uniref:thioredoxin family protein n=1 Tax=Methanohalophilus levihalophilus TaxID=1431282 RepID=UPI001AE686AA|nr:thioredoxin fold domain-containing protein [Methanohalophilus levihalophilus]MBP2031158.1 thiol:disulfide interchange protein [Methanohalophilus levihalophilus]
MNDQNKRAFILIFGIPIAILLLILIGQSSGLLQAGLLSSDDGNLPDGDTVKLGDLDFHTSLDAALIEAGNSGKPVYVYVDSDYCSWCKKFEAEAFHDERVVQMLNSNFERLSVNTARNPSVASSLNVRGTPTGIFLRPDGSEIEDMRIVGYVSADEFLIQLDDVARVN